jgi:glycerol-3-phosphate dehydrogenase subunit B
MERRTLDLLIIGGGLTGVVAARRARQLGLDVLVVAAAPGSLPYTSGALDLIAVYPTETKHYRPSPWEALAELVEHEPDHPYGKVGLGGVQRAWEDVACYLETGPLRYFRRREENLLLVTAAGTLKPTHLVPHSMRANVLAWESKEPTLLLGFERLVDFTPEHAAENLRDRWPGLRAARVDASAVLGEERRARVAELAAAFERPAFRERFAEMVRPRLGSARYLGLPAVLGFDNVVTVVEDLERLLEVPVFEIPLLSPSLPGMRLADLLKADLIDDGVEVLQGQPVVRLERGGDRVVGAVWRGQSVERRLEAESVILATGRFFGGGLVAGRSSVTEPLLGLTVEAPPSRDSWHMRTFLGAPGHPINRVGLVTDAELRPLAPEGRPVFSNLLAAGAILAGHDWVREKSGAGISVVTGHAAAERAGRRVGGRP